MVRGSRWAALAASIALVLAGCIATDNHPVITIDNRLDVPVVITFVNAAGDEGPLLSRIAAHQGYAIDVFPSGSDHCTTGYMVARDIESGEELARSPNPVCRPSTWTIEARAGGSGSPASNP